jgi:translocation and assembly module TamA
LSILFITTQRFLSNAFVLNTPWAWSLLALCLLSHQVWALNLTVEIQGIDGNQKSNAEAYLQIAQERDSPSLTTARLQRLHDRAEEQIKNALAPFGLYRVTVNSELELVDREAEQWMARYQVDPGPPVAIKQLDFQLMGEATQDSRFPQTFGMKEGDALIHADYNKAKENLLFAASELGYLDAGFVHSQAIVDPATNSAQLAVKFDSGRRYYFGEVRFEQAFLSPRYLQRFVEFNSGDPYDQEAVLALQAQLLATDHFSQVEITPAVEEKNDDDRSVPLDVLLTPAKRNKYRFGIGFDTDLGPRVTADWQRRWVNRRGHRTTVETILGPQYRELSGRYIVPLRQPATEKLIFRPEYHYLDSNARTEEIFKFDVMHSIVRDNWQRNWGIEIRYEDSEVGGERNQYEEIVPFIDTTLVKADDRLFASQGYRVQLRLLGTGQFLGSSSNYVSGLIRTKAIKGLGDDYRLIGRADLGATWANGIVDLPASRRFYAGGAQSIRGYGYEALGPRDAEGSVVGGRYLAVGSVELERRIKGDWSGALFYDFGNAFDPDLDNAFRHSVGFGARWRSPVGQIRVDLGFGIESDDLPIQLHLIIGPDF